MKCAECDDNLKSGQVKLWKGSLKGLCEPCEDKIIKSVEMYTQNQF